MKSLPGSVPSTHPGWSGALLAARAVGAAARWVRAALVASIRAYQLVLSPLFGSVCRFAPSCSEYARQAVARYGVRRGLLLGIRRIARCHPFAPGGWDPVP